MNPLIKRIVMIITSTVVKSVMQAYKNTIKNQRPGQAPPNPFKDFFEKAAQQTQIVRKPMTREEALQIFAVEDGAKEKIDTEKLMTSYITMMAKNSPYKGGSFYIQSKLWCAKEEIMKDFREEEKAFYAKNGIKEEEVGKERPEEKKEETAEKKEDEKKDAESQEKK